ncbi:hypothetical protein CIP107521_00222 [Corynebacterium diphtheriae]|nr:hypothetical protein CIP107521_00222 [Corynebacterium diphtheriae]
MKKVVLTFLVAPVVPTSLAAENTRAQSCEIATSNVEYKSTSRRITSCASPTKMMTLLWR